MQKSIRRMFCLFLAIVMCATIIPMSAAQANAATGGTCGDNLTWSYSKSKKTLTISGSGEMWNWQTDNPEWYSFHDDIEKVVIKSGVTSIGIYAFYYCSNLDEITIPSSVVSIGAGAFEETELYKDNDNWSDNGALYIEKRLITVKPKKVESTFNIRKSTTLIADNAFYGCTKLQEITIPENVTSVGKAAFYGCTKLSKITVSDNIEHIGDSCFTSTAFFNNAENRTSTGGLYLGKYLINVAETAKGSFKIKKSTLAVANAAFKGCTGITSVTVQQGVKFISNSIFSGCTALKEVILSDTVTAIGSKAFFNCKALEKITLPESLTSVGANAFYSCTALKSIRFPANVTDIATTALRYCKLESIKVSTDNLMYCSRNNALLSKARDVLYQYATGNTATSYEMPSSVMAVAPEAFYGSTSLKTVKLSKKLTSIGAYAFCGCTALQSIDIPDGVKTIEAYTFANCVKLGKVNLPPKLTSIESFAFFGCKTFATIRISSTVKSIASNAFNSCNSKLKIYCDAGSYADTYAKSRSISTGRLALKVTNVKASPLSSSSIKLTWKAQEKADYYKVYKYSKSKDKFVLDQTVNKNEAIITDLASATTYKFMVKAYRVVDGAMFTSVDSASISQTTKPEAVKNLVAKEKSRNSVTLAWSSVRNADKYRVYIFNDYEGEYELYTTVSGTSCTIKHLAPATSYRFKVRAYKTFDGAKCYGAYSSAINVTTNA